MWKKFLAADQTKLWNSPLSDYKSLLGYINNLASHKLGYPVSLLTFMGLVDNKDLGIKPGSLANVLLNNVGDPFKDSETSRMEVKRHERQIIAILERFYGIPEHGARGYVTTGGTEGNFASMWWSKRYLINEVLSTLIKYDDIIKHLTQEEQNLTLALSKTPLTEYKLRAETMEKLLNKKSEIADNKAIVQQLLTPTVFFTKKHTHYSIPKIAEILRVNIRQIEANPDGSMNLENFRKELLINLSAHPFSAVIAIANIGTTFTGAIDNVPMIKKIIDESKPKPVYTIHMDGALTGFVLPILQPFGDIKNYFEELGVNTLAFSAHKYPGLSQPCGAIIARQEFFNKAFENGERSIEYVGNISDVTITGSRSGLNVLMFYNALCAMGLDKNNDKLTTMVHENMNNANYLTDELAKIYGPENVSYPNHFNVIFPRPSMDMARKYQLMLTGDTANICVLSNVTRELIDEFIHELKAEKEKAMNVTKADYSVLPLTEAHAKLVVDLFTKTFCEYEPITKHLGITHRDFEPFAKEVIQKAVKDGLSEIALSKDGKLMACTIAEDLANPFSPNLAHYPKLKPVIALIDQLSGPFLENKHLHKNKIEHIWIVMVAPEFHGQGVSTAIDMACAELGVRKGFDFAYVEFTNAISANIAHHYPVNKAMHTINYEDFTLEDGTKPFTGLKGSAVSYVIGIRPGIKIDSLQKCYTIESTP